MGGATAAVETVLLTRSSGAFMIRSTVQVDALTYRLCMSSASSILLMCHQEASFPLVDYSSWPSNLKRFLVNTTLPYTTIELQHLHDSNYPAAVAESIQRILPGSSSINHETAFLRTLIKAPPQSTHTPKGISRASFQLHPQCGHTAWCVSAFSYGCPRHSTSWELSITLLTMTLSRS